jgi:DNA-binding LytR/AlgR family response regulator
VVPVSEIRLAGVENEHTFVLTPAGRYGVRSTLSELEQRLKRHPFLRVHRRHLVNLNHVASVEGFFNGTYLLRLSDLPNLAVPVSRRHAPDLKAALGL